MDQNYKAVADPITILWPYRRLNITFQPKNGGAVNSFDYFLIVSVNDGYSVEQISEAMMMPSDIVSSELMALVRQKLLNYSNGKFTLSEQSKKNVFIRMISDDISAGRNEFYIDCITEAPENAGIRTVCRNDDSVIAKETSVDSNDVFEISSDDSFYRDNFDALSNLSDEQYDYFCRSVMCRFETSGGAEYVEKELFAIPAAFHGSGGTPQDCECVIVSSYVIEYTFRADSGSGEQEIKVYFDRSTGEYSDSFDCSTVADKSVRSAIELALHSPDMSMVKKYAGKHAADAELLSEQSLLYYSRIPMSYIRSK